MIKLLWNTTQHQSDAFELKWGKYHLINSKEWIYFLLKDIKYISINTLDEISENDTLIIINKVHFFISMASDRNSSDHCDGLPSCNASILLPLFVSMNSRCMLFLFSAQHLFEARIKQTFEFSASRTSQTDIRKIRKIRIFRLQPSPPVSGALDLLLYLLRVYAGSSPLVPT